MGKIESTIQIGDSPVLTRPEPFLRVHPDTLKAELHDFAEKYERIIQQNNKYGRAKSIAYSALTGSGTLLLAYVSSDFKDTFGLKASTLERLALIAVIILALIGIIVLILLPFLRSKYSTFSMSSFVDLQVDDFSNKYRN